MERDSGICVFGHSYPSLSDACADFGIDPRIVRNRLRKHINPSSADINRAFTLVRAPKIVVDGICFRTKAAAIEYLGIDEDTLARKLPRPVIRYRGKAYRSAKALAADIGVDPALMTERLQRLGCLAPPHRMTRCIDNLRKESRLSQPLRIANEDYPTMYTAARCLGLHSDRLYDALYQRFGFDWPDNPSMQDIFPGD